MAIYKLNQHESESSPTSITLDNGSGVVLCIPIDPENTDYKAYLAWVADGNTAEAAD